MTYGYVDMTTIKTNKQKKKPKILESSNNEHLFLIPVETQHGCLWSAGCPVT